MRKILLTALTAILSGAMAVGQAQVNVPVDYKKFPDANPFPNVQRTKSNTVGNAAPNSAARSSAYAATRPDHVNNALKKFFPPVINQSGGSCGSAQAVYYMMAYEMNSYRNWDASTTDHQLPTHYTWLQTYAGVGIAPIANKHGVPSVTDYGGNTYSRLFGNQDTSQPNFGYMQGYDKWYRAMFNHIVGGDTFCDQNQTTEIGREQLKQWLWNHWGDESFYAGGISGIGVASGGTWGRIPATPTNTSIGVTGKYCVASWGKTYDHALTIVGYDDRIEFDLDSNGVIGEKDKDEVGAWIICNSWGSSWCNGGFIYCPYKYSYSMFTNSIPMNSGHFVWRKDYEPKRVFKILMDYSRRSEIAISAGISTDTAATAPAKTEDMPYFTYAGDGTKADPAPEVPMLGRWRSGMNYDPMEFGYDVTDLTDNCDLTKPLKYFLVIKSKNKALGHGNVYKFSLMDYSVDPEGMEIPAAIDTVAILNGGKTTILSLVTPGQQFYEPNNVKLDGKTLSWTSPVSTYNVARYYIYKEGTESSSEVQESPSGMQNKSSEVSKNSHELLRNSSEMLRSYGGMQKSSSEVLRNYSRMQKIAEVPAISCSYTVDDPAANYYVSTAYDYRGGFVESPKCGPARNGTLFAQEGTNNVLSLAKECLSSPSLLNSASPEATIEFWIKPNSLANNQYIGQGWGSFLFCVSASGQVQCGWSNSGDNSDASNRVVTASRTIKTGTWSHVALVVDHNELTVYVNGMKKGSTKSSTYSGVPALASFCIGAEKGPFDGQIDELRVWNKALSQVDIYRNKGLDVANPTAQEHLIAYYPMETYENGGQLYLKDYAGGNDIAMTAGKTAPDASFLKGAITESHAAFVLPESPCYVGQPLKFTSAAMVNTTQWKWVAPEADISSLGVQNATLTFSKPGTHSVTHIITDVNGVTVDSTRQIEVVAAEAPLADFEIAKDTLGEGEVFHFANVSKAANAKYTWTMAGADVESANSVNATAVYSKTGVYPIKLTATNSGGTSTKTRYITVTHSAPRVLFSASPDVIMLGETAYLVDDTRNNPTEWKWTVSNGKHTYIVDGQNSSLTPQHPGTYDVKLEATNDVGTTIGTQQAALIVRNADSKNGLTFTGHESLTSTADFFDSSVRAFTIEWWMSPNEVNGAIDMTTSNGAFTLQCNQDGVATLTVGGKAAATEEGFVVPNAWHHYAITFNFGSVKFYRDGEQYASTSTRIGTTMPAWGRLVISGGDAHFSGQLDELRIWSKALSLSAMKNYINAPLANIETLVSDNGLVSYYDFNQSGGSVKDRTSNKIDLERRGFGPDGDAWGLSSGVFALDLSNSSDTIQVDADGLTSLQDAVAQGDAPAITGGKGAIRFVMAQPTEVFVYTMDGKLTFRDTIEGTHYLPFLPGIYIVNGVKVRVE